MGLILCRKCGKDLTDSAAKDCIIEIKRLIPIPGGYIAKYPFIYRKSCAG